MVNTCSAFDRLKLYTEEPFPLSLYRTTHNSLYYMYFQCGGNQIWLVCRTSSLPLRYIYVSKIIYAAYISCFISDSIEKSKRVRCGAALNCKTFIVKQYHIQIAQTTQLWRNTCAISGLVCANIYGISIRVSRCLMVFCRQNRSFCVGRAFLACK